MWVANRWLWLAGEYILPLVNPKTFNNEFTLKLKRVFIRRTDRTVHIFPFFLLDDSNSIDTRRAIKIAGYN
jgi:hypothetical protein